jgi:hypothetical protein
MKLNALGNRNNLLSVLEGLFVGDLVDGAYDFFSVERNGEIRGLYRLDYQVALALISHGSKSAGSAERKIALLYI